MIMWDMQIGASRRREAESITQQITKYKRETQRCLIKILQLSS
jgi:hypothetical protein